MIDLDDEPEVALGSVPELLAAVVIGVAQEPRAEDLAALDVGLSVHEGAGFVGAPDRARSLDELVEAVSRSPEAAVVLVQVLRCGEHRSTDEALLYESLAYSTLQGGRTFAAWLEQRGVRELPGEADQRFISLSREEGTLTITLDRPARRNALGARMRDQLCEALDLAAADRSVEAIVLRGAGANFSSGGDLHEFGTAADPVGAHLVRVTRSPAQRLSAMRSMVRAQIHGACFGAGIELPAFVAHVSADEHTRIRLPEIAMGLIPGAGGTASLPRRIGRHRTAWLALSGSELDAQRALSWGLVDEVTVAS